MNKELVLYVLHLISYFLCDRLIVTIGCFGYMCWEGSNLYIKRVEGPNIYGYIQQRGGGQKLQIFLGLHKYMTLFHIKIAVL